MRVKAAETRRQEIVDQQHIGGTGKRVFLAEGEDDKDAFSKMPERRFGNEFEKTWAVAPAGGKLRIALPQNQGPSSWVSRVPDFGFTNCLTRVLEDGMLGALILNQGSPSWDTGAGTQKKVIDRHPKK